MWVIMAPLSMTALGSSGEMWTSSTMVCERMSGGCCVRGGEVVEAELTEWSGLSGAGCAGGGCGLVVGQWLARGRYGFWLWSRSRAGPYTGSLSHWL